MTRRRSVAGAAWEPTYTPPRPRRHGNDGAAKDACKGAGMTRGIATAGSVALLALAAGALVASAGPNGAPGRGRCVGMFLDGAAGPRGMRQVPADATNLTVRGTVPCRDGVMAWAAQGPYRVFEDGTVEFLATPVPPCPGGDHYVWIAFPD